MNLKNCYFVAGTDTGEDSAYMFGGNLGVRDSFDAQRSDDIESCYELVDCVKSNRLRFSQQCVACSDSLFLYDCRNSNNCVGCVGLRNKQFYIFNQPYSKEDYFKQLEKLNSGTIAGLTSIKKQFEKLKLSIPRKYAQIIKSNNAIGDDIIESRNCKYCFCVRNNSENCKYSHTLLGAKDGYDAFITWNKSELFYEVFSTYGQRILFSSLVWGGFDIQYSYNCFDCNNIFGCVGLRNKLYCILNKQYTEEEYNSLLPKIIKHMDEMKFKDAHGKTFGYGEFFPPDTSPFAYNESVAQGYFPRTKDETVQEGFAWRDPSRKDYKITKSFKDMPDGSNIPDSILNEVIKCGHQANCADPCPGAFRIIPLELQFLKKMNLPLPRFCPICRRGERLRLRTPLKLWHRKCTCAGAKSESGLYQNTSSHFHSGECPNEFETPYSSDRPEIVYCEQCYLSEVS